MKKPKKTKNPRTMLRNGCSRTEVFISPENFKSLKLSTDLNKDWFVQCRFFDPEHSDRYPNGFQYRKRTNGIPTLAERKKAMEIYKLEMEEYLDFHHYNPITKEFMYEESGEISKHMDLKHALLAGHAKLNGSPKHLYEVKRCVLRVIGAMEQLQYAHLKISEIKIWHIKNALDRLAIPEYSYNKYRGYLKRVFAELIEYGCVESNPCRDISKRKYEPEAREIISDHQLKYIDPFLKKNYYAFYRFRMIFGFSGGRIAEFFRIQKKFVDLENQEYTVQIQKGQKYVWTTKVILLEAIPYWREILSMTDNPDDYIFSKGLVPGSYQICPSQITRRWNRHIKNKDKIKDEKGEVVKVTADFYTLKHKLLDQIDALEEEGKIITPYPAAQTMGSHTTNRTTGIYATGRSRRKIEFLKKLRLS